MTNRFVESSTNRLSIRELQNSVSYFRVPKCKNWKRRKDRVPGWQRNVCSKCSKKTNKRTLKATEFITKWFYFRSFRLFRCHNLQALKSRDRFTRPASTSYIPLLFVRDLRRVAVLDWCPCVVAPLWDWSGSKCCIERRLSLNGHKSISKANLHFCVPLNQIEMNKQFNFRLSGR